MYTLCVCGMLVSASNKTAFASVQVSGVSHVVGQHGGV